MIFKKVLVGSLKIIAFLYLKYPYKTSIFDAYSIRRRNDLQFENKFRLAVDADNGIWLCENYHKLFDSNLIWFEEGQLCFSHKLNDEDLLFVKHVTTLEQIEPQYINERMLAFFDSRVGIPSRLVLYDYSKGL